MKDDDMKGAVTLDVPLYPASAHVLLQLIEQAQELTGLMAGAPRHVIIDIDNFTNQLRAHLQRVARGE